MDQSNIYGESDYAGYAGQLRLLEYNIGSDSARGPLLLAAAVEDPAAGGRIVLIGDADFVRNGGGFVTSPAYSTGFVYPANVQFMINASNWLLNSDLSLPSFPSPAPTATATITPSPTPIPSPTAEATTAPAQ